MYMFNLIVGTGALTMPRAFATAGWVVSLSLISFLGFMRSALLMPLQTLCIKGSVMMFGALFLSLNTWVETGLDEKQHFIIAIIMGHFTQCR